MPQKLPNNLLEIAVGLLLGDATLYRTKTEGAYMKFEQSYLNKEYVEFVLTIFEAWTFLNFPAQVFVVKIWKLKRLLAIISIL